MRPIDANALNIDREHFDTYADYSHAFDMIDNAPTIDVVPVRHGKWICSDDMYEYACCSVCKKDTGEPFLLVEGHWHYCPNCGARMRDE